MAARSLAVRAAIKAELDKIGVTPSTGWESGAGAPGVTLGRPLLDALPKTPTRQIFVQCIGCDPMNELLGAVGNGYRHAYSVWLATQSEDLTANLERDVRRAMQLGAPNIQLAGANGGVTEGEYRVHYEGVPAGWTVGTVIIFTDCLTAQGVL